MLQTLTVTPNPPPARETRTRVRSLVEEELERVKTLEDAEAVVRRAEQLAAEKTEDEAGKRAAHRVVRIQIAEHVGELGRVRRALR